MRSGGNCPVIISCAECWCGPIGKLVGLSGMSFHDGHWSDLLVLATKALPAPWTPLLARAWKLMSSWLAFSLMSCKLTPGSAFQSSLPMISLTLLASHDTTCCRFPTSAVGFKSWSIRTLVTELWSPAIVVGGVFFQSGIPVIALILFTIHDSILGAFPASASGSWFWSSKTALQFSSRSIPPASPVGKVASGLNMANAASKSLRIGSGPAEPVARWPSCAVKVLVGLAMLQQPPFGPAGSELERYAVDRCGVVQLVVEELHLHPMPGAINPSPSSDRVPKTPNGLAPNGLAPHEVLIQSFLQNLGPQDVVHIEAQ